MDIRVKFNTLDSQAAFAKKWAVDVTPDMVDHLDISWHLLQHALSAESNVTDFVQLDTTTEHEFLVSSADGNFGDLAISSTPMKNMAGWYHVVSTQGLALGKIVKSIDITSIPMTFLDNVSTINSINVTPATVDPTSSAGQWARIRVASQYRPLLTSFATHDVNYLSKPELYILDSGINFEHQELNYDGLYKVNFYTLPQFSGNFADDIGHGTGVASMAVGKNLGICSYVKLMNVKIGGMVNGEQYNANLLDVGQAIDAIMNAIVADPTVTRVINMSWGIPRSAWLDAKVQSLIDAGAFVVCAAGNGHIDVDQISPAGMNTVMTVGAIDQYDIPAGFNNIAPSDSGLTTSIGLGLDIFAPGDNVMVADGISGTTSYHVTSGTSFSAPLVSGVACVIASMNSNPLFYSDLVKLIVNTATEHALLFEDSSFSENQNRLVYLATADMAASYKETNAVSYLGVHDKEDVIVADINSNLDTSQIEKLAPTDPVVFSVEMADDSKDYAQFLVCDPVTGVITITKPNLQLPEETRLKMVNFIGVAKNSSITMKTNILFFFVNNPLYKDTLESDITLALTDVNSISFFATWKQSIK